MPRMLVLLFAALAASPVAAEDATDFFEDGKASLDLRYRFETVEQDDKPQTADANTIRVRLDLASGEVAGFSGHLQADHIEALGNPQYDDTRNGQVQYYPVVAGPDLNQAWLQYRGAKDTILRLGRQKIAIGNERFVGPVGWRQNEQSFDALRLDTRALPGTSITYAWVDRVMRVFGPDEGMPPAELSSDSHLLDARVTSLPVGALALYGYHATLHPSRAGRTSSRRRPRRHRGPVPQRQPEARRLEGPGGVARVRGRSDGRSVRIGTRSCRLAPFQGALRGTREIRGLPGRRALRGYAQAGERGVLSGTRGPRPRKYRRP